MYFFTIFALGFSLKLKTQEYEWRRKFGGTSSK